MPATADPGRALVWAVNYGELSQVEALLQAGANPQQRDEFNCAVILAAARRGDPRIVGALLRRGASVHEAASTLFPGEAKGGLAGSAVGTPLAYAARHGRLAVMELLVRHGAPVDGLDPEGQTALMHAAEAGQLEAVSWLLSHGANPRLRDRVGHTALNKTQATRNPESDRLRIIGLLRAG